MAYLSEIRKTEALHVSVNYRLYGTVLHGDAAGIPGAAIVSV
jgi:hypothetical protein